MRTERDGILVDIGSKSEGVVPTNEMHSLGADPLSKLQPGDPILVFVVQPETEEGQVLLSIDRARGEQGWRVLQERFESGEIFEAEVTGFNKGGLLANVEGVNAFIPMSQVVGAKPGADASNPLAAQVGRTLRLKVIEINRRRNRVILSERAALQEYRAEQKERLLDELAEGEVRTGTHHLDPQLRCVRRPRRCGRPRRTSPSCRGIATSTRRRCSGSARRCRSTSCGWTARRRRSRSRSAGRRPSSGSSSSLATRSGTWSPASSPSSSPSARSRGCPAPSRAWCTSRSSSTGASRTRRRWSRRGTWSRSKIVRIEHDRHRLGLSLNEARGEGEQKGWQFDQSGRVLGLPGGGAEAFPGESGAMERAWRVVAPRRRASRLRPTLVADRGDSRRAARLDAAQREPEAAPMTAMAAAMAQAQAQLRGARRRTSAAAAERRRRAGRGGAVEAAAEPAAERGGCRRGRAVPPRRSRGAAERRGRASDS